MDIGTTVTEIIKQISSRKIDTDNDYFSVICHQVNQYNQEQNPGITKRNNLPVPRVDQSGCSPMNCYRLTIRPSCTEPKVRFNVEARDPDETALLVKNAKSMLAETGLLT